jgi:hypothetical protein
MIIRRLFFLFLAAMLPACKAPAVASPAPTLQAVQVYYPASLQPWADQLTGCASSLPQLGLYLMPSASPSRALHPNDVILQMGNPGGNTDGEYLVQVGWEQLVVIVNSSNPLLQLSDEELQQVFSGQLTHWEGKPAKAIQVWVLPENEPSRMIFDAIVDENQPLAPNTKVAPDPLAVLEAVSADETAIGYLPQSFLSAGSRSAGEKVKILQLSNTLEKELRQPVLAASQKEISGTVRDLLVCLQHSGIQ